MKKQYPVRNYGHVAPTLDKQYFPIPNNIIPNKNVGNRNIAGQCKVRIQMKDNRTQREVNIYSSQQVLNLLNGSSGTWWIGDNNQMRNYRRKNNGYGKTRTR